MRPEVSRVVEALIESSEDAREVSLDALAAALGDLVVTHDEIDEVIEALESRGRLVGEPSAPRGVGRLRAVLQAARALRVELGRAPAVREIAERAGLTEDAVRHALALARVMQR